MDMLVKSEIRLVNGANKSRAVPNNKFMKTKFDWEEKALSKSGKIN